MNTQEILKVIYETKDLNRFKKIFTDYCKEKNISYKIVPLYDGFSRRYQRLTFTWRSKLNNNLYIMGFRTLYNHYIYIQTDNANRFYERKLSLQQVTETITLKPYYKFMDDNEDLLEYLKKKYAPDKKRIGGK